MDNLFVIMRYMQNLDALAIAVSGEMERQKLNTYEVADRARKKGYKIVHGTVWNVINRNVKEVKDKTIIALAHALDLPEQQLFAILRGAGLSEDVIENARFNSIARGYSRLSEQEKQNLEPFLRAIEQTIIKALPDVEITKQKKIKPEKNTKKTFSTRDGKTKMMLVSEASSAKNDD